MAAMSLYKLARDEYESNPQENKFLLFRGGLYVSYFFGFLALLVRTFLIVFVFFYRYGT